jgi:hypothetical protein
MKRRAPGSGYSFTGNIHGFRGGLEDSRVKGAGVLTSRQDLILDEVQFFGFGVKSPYD